MATEFQERVFAALRRIPSGEIRSYGELAKELGSSPRAIGQALKKNPDAPRTPCHRVIGADGRIGGYMGKAGLESPELQKKRALLEVEGHRFDAQGKLLS